MIESEGLFSELPDWGAWVVLGVLALIFVWRQNMQKKRDSGESKGTGFSLFPSQQTERQETGAFRQEAIRDLTANEIRALKPEYAPWLDGEPDPGEVVWIWVPFVEYDGRGKDRPVLIIARIDDWSWAGCYLSTKPHAGFISVGSGPWDSKGRESFLAPDRVLRITEKGLRREASGMAREVFDRAVDAVERRHRRSGRDDRG